MKILKNLIISILFSMCLPFLFCINAYATGSISTNSIQTIDNSTKTNTNEEVTFDNLGKDILPEADIGVVNKWSNEKGNDVIGVFQNASRSIAIVSFIICAFITMFGVIAKNGMAGKGIIGMAVVVISYTCILFAPEIVAFLSSWLAF